MDKCKVIDIFSRVDREQKNTKERLQSLLQRAQAGNLSAEERARGLGRLESLLKSTVPR